MLSKIKNHPASSNASLVSEYVKSELLKSCRYDMDPVRPLKVFIPNKKS